MRAFGVVVGFGLGGAAKGMIVNIMPNVMTSRFGSLLTLALGGIVTANSKTAMAKGVGGGLVAWSVYDLLVSNIPAISNFLPTVSPPAMLSGAASYGRNTYGASLPHAQQPVEVVSGNISSDVAPEIVSADYDLADMMEMSD
jgi:hypothetical protein